jgi:hypothetical protein
MYPSEWDAGRSLRLVVNQDTVERIKRGEAPENIERSWAPSLADFERRRALYLLYK